MAGVGAPVPPGPVLVVPRRPVEELAVPVDPGGHEVREVLVGPGERRVSEDLPEDPIGEGPPRAPVVCEAHEVHLGDGVELEDHEDLEPLTRALEALAALDEGPVTGQGGPDPLEVLELPVEVRVLIFGQEPEGPQMPVEFTRGSSTVTKSWMGPP